MSSTVIPRRMFLQAAAPVALGLGAVARGQLPVERRFSDDDIPLVREQLLGMVNAERAAAGLSRLQLDELACRVASAHARDMALGLFLSHWGSDGRKPYHRYSFAGGTEAVQENVSSADNIQSLSSNGVLQDLHDMHQSMIDEVAPHDGHKRTILFPRQTHVGFGVAMLGRSIRLDEVYLARYIAVDPLPRQVKPKEKVLVMGKVLQPKLTVIGSDLYHEPFPAPPAIEWLREPRPYGMPATSVKLYPKLPKQLVYVDGSTGSIETDGSNFRFRVTLSKEPGINTILIWLSPGEPGTEFPATQICIRVG